jgi:hypothetical protein
MSPRVVTQIIGVVLLLCILCLTIGVYEQTKAQNACKETFSSNDCSWSISSDDSRNTFAEYDPLNEFGIDFAQQHIVDPVVARLNPNAPQLCHQDLLVPCRAPKFSEFNVPKEIQRQHAQDNLNRHMSVSSSGGSPIYKTVEQVMGRFDPHTMAAYNPNEDYTTQTETLKYEGVASNLSTPYEEIYPESQQLPAVVQTFRKKIIARMNKWILSLPFQKIVYLKDKSSQTQVNPSILRQFAKSTPTFELLSSCVVRICRPWRESKKEFEKRIEHIPAEEKQVFQKRHNVLVKQKSIYYVWRDLVQRRKLSHGFYIEWTCLFTPKSQHVELWNGRVVAANVRGFGNDEIIKARRNTFTDNTQQMGFLAAHSNQYNTIVPSLPTVMQKLRNRLNSRDTSISEDAFRCVDQPQYYSNKERCLAVFDEYGRSKSKGIWDAPCINDNQCPFFKANNNYPNVRGQCRDDGTCEMPIGVTRIGYRQYDKRTAPLCHNCILQPPSGMKSGMRNIRKSFLYPCANQQKNQKKPFELLATPDYAFLNDYRERVQFSKQLKTRGLQI